MKARLPHTPVTAQVVRSTPLRLPKAYQPQHGQVGVGVGTVWVRECSGGWCRTTGARLLGLLHRSDDLAGRQLVHVLRTAAAGVQADRVADESCADHGRGVRTVPAV